MGEERRDGVSPIVGCVALKRVHSAPDTHIRETCMDLKFALVAELVSETRDGKLNIMGTFDRIVASKAPATHHSLHLVARFEARVSEGTQHKVKFGLYDADGAAVIPQSPDIDMVFQNTGPGRPFRGQVILHMAPVKLPKFGDYEFHILVDGHLKAEVPLSLVQRREE